jgi:NADPH:quinone reductase-like Zn-dependent oxidoreductase
VAPGGAYVSVDDGTPGFTAADLSALAELVESGAIRAVIDRVYPLERIAEAHRYVETDHKRGNVVVTVA